MFGAKTLLSLLTPCLLTLLLFKKGTHRGTVHPQTKTHSHEAFERQLPFTIYRVVWGDGKQCELFLRLASLRMMIYLILSIFYVSMKSTIQSCQRQGGRLNRKQGSSTDTSSYTLNPHPFMHSLCICNEKQFMYYLYCKLAVSRAPIGKMPLYKKTCMQIINECSRGHRSDFKNSTYMEHNI